MNEPNQQHEHQVRDHQVRDHQVDGQQVDGQQGAAPGPAGQQAVNPDRLEWLSLPEVAERLGCKLSAVRRMLAEGQLLAARRGERAALSVPAVLLGPDGPLPELPGTVTVLADNGLRDAEALEWLFAPDPTLTGGSPIGALLAGHKTEVRRRAQALG